MTILVATLKTIGTLEAEDLAQGSQKNLGLRYRYGVSETNVTVPEDVPGVVTLRAAHDKQTGPGTIAQALDATTLLTERRLKAHRTNVAKLLVVLGKGWEIKQVVTLFAPVRLYVLLSNGTDELIYRSKNGMSNGTGVTEVVGLNGKMKNTEAVKNPTAKIARLEEAVAITADRIKQLTDSKLIESANADLAYYEMYLAQAKAKVTDRAPVFEII